MLKFDDNEKVILSIKEDTEITLEVNGGIAVYKPYKNNDNSWDLVAGYENDMRISYGLSCGSLRELMFLLLADYTTGIITEACIIQ